MSLEDCLILPIIPVSLGKNAMPLCMILVLPMFLNNHHYLKTVLFFPSFKEKSCFFPVSLLCVLAVRIPPPALGAAPRSTEQADVFSWDRFQWQSTSPSIRRRAADSALARRAAAFGCLNQQGAGKARAKDHN